VSRGTRCADHWGMSTRSLSTTFAAARSRAHGPTAALWHAVELHRPTSEVDGACELTLCGSLARVDVDRPWPTPARDVCPACVVLSR
jgi:hypothetical protein